MPSKLPGAWALVSDSWKLYIATWSQTTKISVWLVYLGLAQFAGLVLIKLHYSFYALLIPLQLAVVVFSVWVGIRLVKAALRAEDGQRREENETERKEAWSFFWPLIFVGFLQVLITFGATLLLVIPGIYFGLVLSFAQIILLDQNKRGFAALGSSWDLVKGRWWATFWRNLVAGVIFSLGVALLVALVLAIFAIVLSPSGLNNLIAGQDTDPLLEGAYSLINSVIQAAILPLFMIFQAKFYRALMKTR